VRELIDKLPIVEYFSRNGCFARRDRPRWPHDPMLGESPRPHPTRRTSKSGMAQSDTDIIERTEQIIGYRFNDENLLQEALTHSSVADHHLASNERMEFLGDAVLGFVVCEYLYSQFPDLREGDLTKIKSAVVSRKVCAMISDKTGLTELLSLGKGMTDRGELPSSIAAAVYESIVAAIYLDGGLAAARRFILEHMAPAIVDAEESSHQNNYKSLLQQHAQRAMADLPIYTLLDEKGPDHSKCFEVAVDIAGRRFPAAWGGSKKEAEQNAALNALAELGIVKQQDLAADGGDTVGDAAGI